MSWKFLHLILLQICCVGILLTILFKALNKEYKPKTEERKLSSVPHKTVIFNNNKVLKRIYSRYSENEEEIGILLLLREGSLINIQRFISDLKLWMKGNNPITISIVSATPELKKSLTGLPSVNFIDHERINGFMESFLSQPAPTCNAKEHSPIQIYFKDINSSRFYNYDVNSNKVGNNSLFPRSKFNRINQMCSSEDSQLKSDICRGVAFIKKIFSSVLKAVPFSKYFIILQDTKALSKDVFRYFTEMAEIFMKDKSIYCVSATASLAVGKVRPVVDFVRHNHFLHHSALLVERALLQEIAEQYSSSWKNCQHLDRTYTDNAMKDVAEWLSWWKNRKLRECIGPTSLVGGSSWNSINNNKLDSLIKHKYSKQLLSLLLISHPLTFDELPCKSNNTFGEKNLLNETFSLYVKMNSLDDDNSMVRALKCSLPDTDSLYGNYEGILTVNWHGAIIFIIGVPYSTFTESIKNTSQIFMHYDIPLSAEKIEGTQRYEDLKHEPDKMKIVDYVTLD